MAEITVPDDLLLGTVIEGPVSGDWVWDQAPGTLTVKAKAPISHAEPAALAALAAWADFQRARGVTLELDDSLKSPYAWRIALLASLAGRSLTSPSSVTDFLQPTPVRTVAENTALLQAIGPLLNLSTEQQRVTVISCLSEILRNVVEHAESERGAYVCCSHFRKADRVSIAVVDTGVGVPTTIRRKYGASLTDSQAIEAAVQWRVTGASATTSAGGSFGLASNYGVGLYYARSAAVHTGGQFALISDQGYVRSEQPESVLPGQTRSRWRGTAVAISFRPSRATDAWQKTREALATPRTNRKVQIVSWGPPPTGAKRVVITPTVAGFVEDKDQANRVRETVILPEVSAGRPVGIDLTQARIISHTFAHALLYMPVIVAGQAAKQLLYIHVKEPQVRDIIRIVAQYASGEARTEENEPTDSIDDMPT